MVAHHAGRDETVPPTAPRFPTGWKISSRGSGSLYTRTAGELGKLPCALAPTTSIWPTTLWVCIHGAGGSGITDPGGGGHARHEAGSHHRLCLRARENVQRFSRELELLDLVLLHLAVSSVTGIRPLSYEEKGEARNLKPRSQDPRSGPAGAGPSALTPATEGPTADPAPPRYQILGLAGTGGMGVVYRAEDTLLGRMVAFKFLPPSLTPNPQAKAQFLNEARAASALDHPNICTIYEVGETAEGQLYLAMAFYEGETLKQRLERGPLPVAEALHIALQVARGLAKAHRHGIVHRDIKPANLMLDADGIVKILDFGIARLPDQSPSGPLLGTPGYMSSEQARAGEVDARSDVWSLGVVLREMLTGWRPGLGGLTEVSPREEASSREGVRPAPAASTVWNRRSSCPDARRGAGGPLSGCGGAARRSLRAGACGRRDGEGVRPWPHPAMDSGRGRPPSGGARRLCDSLAPPECPPAR